MYSCTCTRIPVLYTFILQYMNVPSVQLYYLFAIVLVHLLLLRYLLPRTLWYMYVYTHQYVCFVQLFVGYYSPKYQKQKSNRFHTHSFLHFFNCKRPAVCYHKGPELRPPGGASTREVGRSVMKLPQF